MSITDKVIVILIVAVIATTSLRLWDRNREIVLGNTSVVQEVEGIAEPDSINSDYWASGGEVTQYCTICGGSQNVVIMCYVNKDGIMEVPDLSWVDDYICDECKRLQKVIEYMLKEDGQ